ncbi:MAG: winged helix-turn-helix domain-containing protein, partial [Candidatus Hodarchaeales archaeon]
MKSTPKVFDVLSHKIRFETIKQLNLSQKSFSELLDSFKEIKSNQFSFHLKKLVDSALITKKGSSYELTELGILTLQFIEAYETDQTLYLSYSPKGKIKKGPSKIIERVLQLPEEINEFPPCVRTFDLFVGENAEYMMENFSFPLPQPIELDVPPQIWIDNYREHLNNLLSDEKAKVWLENRLLKLAYGTRGLSDFGLMDATLSVPPLALTISRLQDLLLTRGKAGLFASTGMGKSRFMLYLAYWWIETIDSAVIFIESPKDVTDKEWIKITDILTRKQSEKSGSPRWLIILEDLHLVSPNSMKSIMKFIAEAGPHSWSILTTFTEMEIDQLPQLSQKRQEFNESLDYLRTELSPLEKSSFLDLEFHWPEWRPYFAEWTKWVALDVLINQVPWKELSYESYTVESYKSPWAIVVSLGFLKSALSGLQRSSKESSFPLILYGIISLLFLIRGEKDLTQSELYIFMENSWGEALSNIFPKSLWKEETWNLILYWTNPLCRLLPPINYKNIPGRMAKEPVVSIYHQEWARGVSRFLFAQNTELYYLITNLLVSLIPSVFSIWKDMTHKNTEFKEDFIFWFQEKTRFEINK